jgi:S-formylglutathione hydrolase FrmB
VDHGLAIVLTAASTVSAMVSRRAVVTGSLGAAVVLGAGAVALAANGVIPGRARVDEELGFCTVDPPSVHAAPGPIIAGGFTSAYRRTDVRYKIAYPPGSSPGARLPVALVLHGYGGNADSALDAGNYPAYLAAAVIAGATPFALGAVDGGNGYWHPHPADDPLGMLIHEFLPLLGTHGLSVDRPAVTGISMGGYGALLCGLTQRERFVAVIGNSPAFWHSYAEARHVNPGAFTSASEWSAYGDMLARAGDFRGLPVQIFIGSSDPFQPIVATLRDRLPDRSIVHITKGCHDGRFWQAHAPQVIGTLAGALAA